MARREISDVAFYHRAGDIVPEGESIVQDNDPRLMELIEERASSGKMEHLSALDQIGEILRLVDAAELADGNEAQKKFLQERKQKVRQYIQEVLEAVREYLGAIFRQNVHKVEDAENANVTQRDEMAEKTVLDEARKIKHTKLIDAINIANRYIRQNFCAMSEGDMERYEAALAERKQPILEVKRFKFPAEGICPDYVDTGVRDSVLLWAERVAEELGEIK